MIEQYMDKIKRNGSTSRWRKIRLGILRRDNYTCYYCGIPTATTVDHLTPVEQGGDDSFNNLVSACSNCNYSKGNRTEEQYIKARNRKHKRKMINKTQFFEHDKTPPTPAMSFSPKGLKTPFELPKGVSCND
jgi:5-methylcytosine-specific restriction endonuclease McrA